MADQEIGLGWQPWDMNGLKLEEYEAGVAWLSSKLRAMKTR